MSNIHLISSSSYHVINNKIKEIIGDNTNITTHSLNDVTIFDCIDDASYFGLSMKKELLSLKMSNILVANLIMKKSVKLLKVF